MRWARKTLEIDGIVSTFYQSTDVPDNDSLYVRGIIQLIADFGDHGDVKGNCNCHDLFPSNCYPTGFQWSALVKEMNNGKKQ